MGQDCQRWSPALHLNYLQADVVGVLPIREGLSIDWTEFDGWRLAACVALEDLRGIYEAELKHGLPKNPEDFAPTDAPEAVKPAIRNVEQLLQAFPEPLVADGDLAVQVTIVTGSGQIETQAVISEFAADQFGVTTFFSAGAIEADEGCA